MTFLSALAAAIGAIMAAASLYLVGVDGAPGAPVVATLATTAGLALIVTALGRRLSRGAARATVAVGMIVAGLVAFRSHEVLLTAPLAPRPEDLPSATDAPPSPDVADAVARARSIVRATAWSEHLPGVSVAVGRGGALLWAEGFGWRDLATRTPVTPATRFVIGTAATAVLPSVEPLGLSGTGADDAAVWSPEHIGEPEEDFPGFRMLRDVVFTPLGLVRPQPLPGDRATFYVPREAADPRRGRRLMAMRDLACCADGRAFSSTPSDLVRVAMAARPGHIDGRLAGGTVVSLDSGREGLVVTVASNVAHAGTAALAARIVEVFGGR